MRNKLGVSGKAEVVELIAAAINYLVFIDPHIALSSQHIDMGLRGPVRMGLAAIGITEGQMHAGKFFVL
jgi:hypothetical protein